MDWERLWCFRFGAAATEEGLSGFTPAIHGRSSAVLYGARFRKTFLGYVLKTDLQCSKLESRKAIWNLSLRTALSSSDRHNPKKHPTSQQIAKAGNPTQTDPESASTAQNDVWHYPHTAPIAQRFSPPQPQIKH